MKSPFLSFILWPSAFRVLLVLLGTDDTRDDLFVDVGRTGQSATLNNHVVDEMPIGIGFPAHVVLRTGIQTHVLRGKMTIIG